MSLQIALTKIKIKNINLFMVSFQKYVKTLPEKSIIPILVMESKPVSRNLGHIEIPHNGRPFNIESLVFEPNEDAQNEKPRISEDGIIQNGFARLVGDEDYQKGIRGIVSPMNHRKLENYYASEVSLKKIQDMGFAVDDYKLTAEGTEFFATREVEGTLTANAF